jgi:hypothetical protein
MTSPSDRPRSTRGWWLSYLVAAVLGVLAGTALFDWATG